MPWGRIDDKLWNSRKWRALSSSSKALWVTALSYRMDHVLAVEIDGLMEPHDVRFCRGSASAVRGLVNAELWHESGHQCPECPKIPAGAYIFHDWLTYQPSREKVIADRKAAAVRQARMRDLARAKRESDGVSHGVTNGVSHAHPDPTRPDPIDTHLGNGGEPKHRASSHPPQPCGRSHDPAENCGACAGARRSIEDAKAAAAKARQDAAASERASRAESQRQAIASCELCNARGLLPSGKPCPHEPPAPAGTGRAAIAKFRAATTKEEA